MVGVRPVDWVGFLDESHPKLQGVWAKQAGQCRRTRLLATLGEDDAADFRSFGGVGAGSFLTPYLGEYQKCKVLPDGHFTILLRDRLLLSVCPEGARCKHRRPNGQLCGALLDKRGWHARKCNIGGGVDLRHKDLCDWGAHTYSECHGLAASREQHVPQWDREFVDPETGAVRVEQAILDVATADARTGRALYYDFTVKAAHSDDPARRRARAQRDGRAAADAAGAKRNRYSLAGPALVPLPFEAGGRPAKETETFVRQCGSAHEDELHTAILWQECSTLLQRGNAELILSAIGV